MIAVVLTLFCSYIWSILARHVSEENHERGASHWRASLSLSLCLSPHPQKSSSNLRTLSGRLKLGKRVRGRRAGDEELFKRQMTFPVVLNIGISCPHETQQKFEKNRWRLLVCRVMDHKRQSERVSGGGLWENAADARRLM